MRHFLVPAIRDKRRLMLRYRGRPCLVEPHAYGLDRHGEPALLCYQIPAGGMPAAAGGWRELKLRDARAVSETGERFAGARPGYNRNDTGLQAIFAQL